jgi:hypothetical protein
MFNIKLNVQQGFTPGTSAPPKCNNPSNRYYIVIIKRRGGMGGQALSPPSSCECFVFRVRFTEFSGARKKPKPFFILLKNHMPHQ